MSAGTDGEPGDHRAGKCGVSTADIPLCKRTWHRYRSVAAIRSLRNIAVFSGCFSLSGKRQGIDKVSGSAFPPPLRSNSQRRSTGNSTPTLKWVVVFP